LEIIGPEYIDLAFRFAKEAGASGLYINDFNTHEPARLAALQNLVEGLLSRGVPVEGVGHQTHIQIFWPSLDEIRDSIQIFANMGLNNQITELDVSAYSDSTSTAPVPEERLVQQGYRYRDLFNLFREMKDSITAVTIWGVGDDTTWLRTFPITREDKPLPFDDELQAKHAYWGIVDPLRLPVVPKTLQVAQGAVRIDGLKEPRWNSAAAQPLQTRENASSWAQFRALWNRDTLYLFVEASDKLGHGDRIDVYFGAAHFVFKGIGKQHKPGVESVLLPTPRGYRLEAAIKAGRPLAVNNRPSFDVRVTDSSGKGRLSWSDISHQQDVNTSGFGELMLIAAP
jgi:endo-1,4-beta-xylanase